MTLALPTTVVLIDLRVVFSLFCSKRSKFSSKRIARSAKAFSAALANFWILTLQRAAERTVEFEISFSSELSRI